MLDFCILKKNGVKFYQQNVKMPRFTLLLYVVTLYGSYEILLCSYTTNVGVRMLFCLQNLGRNDR